MKKIHAFRMSGYKVFVWHEEDLDTFEKMDEKMKELQTFLGCYDEEEMKKYEQERRNNYHTLFE